MSTAVRQQLIVMLISKLLPPSLHSFSSSFVFPLSLSLSTLPPSLSPSPLHSRFPPLFPAVISISPPPMTPATRQLPLFFPSPSPFSSAHSPSLTLSLHPFILCLFSPSLPCSLLPSVSSDVSLPPLVTLFSLLHFPLPSSSLISL